MQTALLSFFSSLVLATFVQEQDVFIAGFLNNMHNQIHQILAVFAKIFSALYLINY